LLWVEVGAHAVRNRSKCGGVGWAGAGVAWRLCVTGERPQLIDQHLLCDPKQQFAMASAEEKWKGELKDQHVMGNIFVVLVTRIRIRSR
jgi:hypothetical protein